MKIENRFWVMKQLPVGNNFQDALEIKHESEIEIPEGFFVQKTLIYLWMRERECI